MRPDEARADLAAWRDDFPADPYRADDALRGLNAHYVEAARLESLESRAADFGRRVVAEIAPAAARYEQRDHLPEIARFDAIGRRTEGVSFDPDYHRAGRVVWASGVVTDSGTPGRAFEQATLLYLLSLEGEAGHACPVVCTIGLARALRRKADADVRDRFLPPLLVSDYDRAERASQFLTEVQGGSDVGANETRAEPAGDGTYLLTGEKWFCSVADADQLLVTARVAGGPEGTRGLGCFVVPRHLGGAPNGFTLRRLKDKLGTRGMASAEIDLDRARAWPIGPVEEGFKTAVGVVLNTSRWMTAVGSTGMMRRAYLEAAAYARHRRAFGQPIGRFPLVRSTLARMKTAWLGALHVAWLLTALEDRIDAGTADEADVAFHRFLVNATKYAVSRRATEVVRDGIEVLGGNGTIEEFSVLARLYRDTIVYESWEGTHNVLVTQVLNDLRRLDLAPVVRARVTALLDAADAPVAAAGRDALERAMEGVARSIDDPAHGAMHFRAHLDEVVAATTIGALVTSPVDAAPSCAGMILRERLEPGYRPADDPDFESRVDAVLGDDVP